MTKGKVIQIGIFVSLIGLISYKFVPEIGIDNFTASTISSCVLILIVVTWVTSYVYRVVEMEVNIGREKRKGLTLCAKDKNGYYPLNTAHDGRPILMNRENLIKFD